MLARMCFFLEALGKESTFKLIRAVASMSLQSIPGSQISGSKVKCSYNFIRCCQIPLCRGCNILHPKYQYANTHFCSLTCRVRIYKLTEMLYPTIVLLYLSSIMSKDEYLFIWLKDILFLFLCVACSYIQLFFNWVVVLFLLFFFLSSFLW
jgi:hypothetical protein